MLSMTVHIRAVCIDYRTIYEQLGMAVSEEQRALYSQRVEEITPNVRYCAYNMKDMPSDLSELMKLRSSAHGDEMLASKIDVRLRSCDDHVINFYTGSLCWLKHSRGRHQLSLRSPGVVSHSPLRVTSSG